VLPARDGSKSGFGRRKLGDLALLLSKPALAEPVPQKASQQPWCAWVTRLPRAFECAPSQAPSLARRLGPT
jgi:hypothetical protein